MSEFNQEVTIPAWSSAAALNKVEDILFH